MIRRFFQGLLPFVGVLALAAPAQAQEIQVTGPLAGAPAVRNLRQHRKARFELAPTVSFTLLDEYQRTILVGARLQYNITDWLGIGVWGAYGAVQLQTGLSDKIQGVYDQRFDRNGTGYNTGSAEAGRRLTALNVGQDFKKQIGTLNWVIAPQLTVVPFRGKLAIFEKLFVDVDAYFFAGPAFVGLKEREECGSAAGQVNCSAREDTVDGPGTGNVLTKGTSSRVAVAPTFGLGLTFFTGRWTSFGVEWRGLPYSWNTGGFVIRGQGSSDQFPDNKVNDKDREFKFNNMISLSFSMYFPRELKVSE